VIIGVGMKTLGEWTYLILRFLVLIVVVLWVLYSCFSDYSNSSFSRNIETYEEWTMYYHSGIEYDDFIFSQDNEKVRQSFVDFMNKMYMEKVHGGKIPDNPQELRINEMVTTTDDGNTLMIYNLGNLMVTDQKEFTDEYFDKIIDYQIDSSNLDEYDSAIYGFIDKFFTKLIIHNDHRDKQGMGLIVSQTQDELECSGIAFMDNMAKSLARIEEMKEKAKTLKAQRK
jgi:hypothetical protein